MNNFDATTWEDNIYSQGNQLNKYPFDNVVTFIFRNYPRDKKRNEIKILEVGSGAGNNLWFLAREGFQVTGIDGSVTAIDYCKKKFKEENLTGEFLVGDFTQLPFDSNTFDIVIDRGAIVCCSLSAGKEAVREINRVLITGGKFFFNPYSQSDSSFSSGELLENGQITNVSEGMLTGIGSVCLYSIMDIYKTLQNNWKIEKLVHKELRDVTVPKQIVHAQWEVTAEKI